jgi:hypothetical protein
MSTRPNFLDIGTGSGYSAALMALNAPQAKIFTINIPPDELLAGKGGTLTTIALEPGQIGSYYRERNFDNIEQILANTSDWEPDIGVIDVAFVNGSHDIEFVYNDTRKIIKHMKSGSFVLWHDFNLSLITNYHWIKSVCLGIENLYCDGLINEPILNLRDSWVGIHQIKLPAYLLDSTR